MVSKEIKSCGSKEINYIFSLEFQNLNFMTIINCFQNHFKESKKNYLSKLKQAFDSAL